MTRRPLNRHRKLIISDHMLECFRAALQKPDDIELQRALDVATNRKRWQMPIFDPDNGSELQVALLAKLDDFERELWDRHVKKRRRAERAFARATR